MKLKIVFLFSFCIMLTSAEMFAHKGDFSLSFSNIKVKERDYWFEENLLNLDVEYNHNINSYFGVGGYAGFGIFEEWDCQKENNTVTSTFLKYSSSFHYGLNSKFHLLPLVLKDGFPRLDLYVSGKVGLISLNSSAGENIIPAKGSYFDYSLMLGGSVYLTKKFGVYAEAGYKSYKYYQGFNARYGLAFRF